MTMTSSNDYSQISIQILQRLGAIEAPPSKDQISIKCLSPEHTDHHASMSVSISKGLCHCFSCGYSGKLTSVYYNITGHSIYRDLGISRSMFTSYTHNDEALKEASLENAPEVDFSVGFKSPLVDVSASENGMKWAKSRGFDPAFCDMNGIRYSDFFEVTHRDTEDVQKYYSCIVIPIYENGKLLSFEARPTYTKREWLASRKRKGLEADEKLFKKVLYPSKSSINTLFQYEQLDRTKPLFITEGLMDMLSLRTDPHFKNSSCMFHCNPTERQVFLLKRFDSVIYVVDNDIPGLSACLKLMDKLPGKVSYLKPPTRDMIKDVNDILQGKDSAIKSVGDLIRMGWLDRISDDRDALKFSIAAKKQAIS